MANSVIYQKLPVIGLRGRLAVGPRAVLGSLGKWGLCPHMLPFPEWSVRGHYQYLISVLDKNRPPKRYGGVCVILELQRALQAKWHNPYQVSG